MNDKTLKLTFIYDSGHGWLRVPALYLGSFQASEFSYWDAKHGVAYLEEDLDAGAFLQALALGFPSIIPSIEEKHVDGSSSIRDLPRFPEQGIQSTR